MKIKRVTLDGKEQRKFNCPGCDVWGYVDDDQLHGMVSILCDCGFHETLDLDSLCSEGGS